MHKEKEGEEKKERQREDQTKSNMVARLAATFIDEKSLFTWAKSIEVILVDTIDTAYLSERAISSWVTMVECGK